MADGEHRIETVLRASIAGTLADSVSGSRIVAGLRDTTARLAPLVGRSDLFRWLRDEPEAEAVVIDLRETRTIGSAIVLVEWTIAHVEPHWRRSAVNRAVGRARSLGRRAVETRIGQSVVSLLVPTTQTGTRDETR